MKTAETQSQFAVVKRRKDTMVLIRTAIIVIVALFTCLSVVTKTAAERIDVPPFREEARKALESQGFTAEEIERVRQYMGDLLSVGAPEVSSSFLQRNPEVRLKAIGKLAEQLENHLNRADVPPLSPEVLHSDKSLLALYYEFIKELHELAAYMDFMNLLQAKSGSGAPLHVGSWTTEDVWGYVVHYATGHPTQIWRIKIAKERLRSLSGKSEPK